MGRLIASFCCGAILAALVTGLLVAGPSSQTHFAPTAAVVATTPPPGKLNDLRTPMRPTMTTKVSRPSPPTTPSLRADPAQLATCSQPEQGVLATPTEHDFIRDVVGVWLLCQTPSVFGTNEQGLEISPDGSWFKLVEDPRGLLAVVPGWGNQGTWAAIDTSAMNGPGTYQLNLKINGEGTVITLPVFSSGPPKMRLSNDGVYTADYVPSLPPSNST